MPLIPPAAGSSGRGPPTRVHPAQASCEIHIRELDPATDGRVVVAWFGSQGLYAYTVAGTPLWKVDLGRVNAGGGGSRDDRVGTGELTGDLGRSGHCTGGHK